LKAITKAAAIGFEIKSLNVKRGSILYNPLNNLVGGRGMGCLLCRPEDLLNKNVSYTFIIIETSIFIGNL
jgi:hypothetical protein